MSQSLAGFIASGSLDAVRKFPANDLGMADWYDGRVSAAALLYPTPETLAAKNEIRFLNGDYRSRHYGR
jgi:hypothetical protein